MSDLPPEIQKKVDEIHMRAEAGVPLHRQRNRIVEALKNYLDWRVGLTKHLTDTDAGEDEQGQAEASERGSQQPVNG